MNKLKKLLKIKDDPSTLFSGFEDNGIVVMVYVPTNDKEKSVWLVKFHTEDGEKLLCEKRFKRSPTLPKFLTDKKVLRGLQDNIDKVLEELHARKAPETKQGSN